MKIRLPNRQSGQLSQTETDYLKRPIPKSLALFKLRVDSIASDGSLGPRNGGNCGSRVFIHYAPSKVAVQVLCRHDALWAWGEAVAPLEGLKELGFVCFGNAVELVRLVEGCCLEETVPPAKGCGE